MNDPFPLVDISREITITDARQLDLLRLRSKIIKAIRFSRKYWMIYRDGAFGVATTLDLTYKKSFIEVLFYTNHDVLDRGVQLVEINTTIDAEVDFDKIIVDLELDSDGLVSPEKIIAKINELIGIEINYHTALLDLEVQLINEHFENYSIQSNPYFREVRIYFPTFMFKVKVNFVDFPLRPKIFISKNISNIISVNELDIIREWDEEHFPHIFELLEDLSDTVADIMKITPLSKDSQRVWLEDVSTGDGVEGVYLRAQRGQSVGIFLQPYGVLKNRDEKKESSILISQFFEVISGKRKEFSGQIKLFGQHIQLITKDEMKKICNVTSINQFSDKITVSKVITKYMKKNFPSNIHSVKFVDSIMYATGLISKKKKKISSLSELQRILLSIATELFKFPRIVMIILPTIKYNRLEVENFNRYINIIKKKFHLVMLIYGPKEVISSCDQIISITENVTEVGSVRELVENITEKGRLIAVELLQPDPQAFDKISSIDSVIAVEERKHEKYKIFPTKDINKSIDQLAQRLGANLYHIKIFDASLKDYSEYMKLKKQIS